MKKNFIPIVLLILLLIPGFLNTQIRREIRIPDIKGYKTLIGDFHIHTLFSDGDVWPTIRVEEAYREGLDVIAITDHVETDYKSSTEDIPVKYNRAYELALPRAQELGILLIKATEITRDMPPGHLNALFIQDETPMTEKDPFKAIELAVNQGAFIIWNHPGWDSQLNEDKVVRWYEEHTKLLKKGWLKGIEVVNWDEYYPEAFDWALEKKLTLFGNSDIHTRIEFKFEPLRGQHRPYTLVFAKEWTLKGVRDAFENQRTLIYDRHFIMGRVEWLKPLFKSCIDLITKALSSNKSGKALIRITNNSDIPIMIKTNYSSDAYTLTEKISILPQTTEILTLRFNEEANPGVYYLNIPITVTNFLKNPRQGINSTLKLKVINKRTKKRRGNSH
ncbi:MAG: histidinol-phosphatase [Spirochaetes bacterium]|nr:histidinol-phosphatase [Spirochaetota bacterium]